MGVRHGVVHSYVGVGFPAKQAKEQILVPHVPTFCQKIIVGDRNELDYAYPLNSMAKDLKQLSN